MGNWSLECRLFKYFGDVGQFAKRLLASRVLSGWNEIDVQPTNPECVIDLVFTKVVVDSMTLYAYGEHLSDMGKVQFISLKVTLILTSSTPLMS